ncbi:MAG: HAMP domain-containing sensor histidine kinase, partial [Acidaminococcaceae bacterium]
NKVKSEVIFEVSDNGPGILETDLPHIFERFYAQHAKTYGTRHGTGLGLSLCKSIVEAHGGKIAIYNKKPHGTLVRFCLPVKEESNNATIGLSS